MIEKIGNQYLLECDYCNNYKGGFKSFDEIIEYEQNFNWKDIYVEGIWINKCPKCLNMNNYSI